MKITCCRKCDSPRSNRFVKGCFIKEFDDLESFVKFWKTCRHTMWFPNLKRELDKNQWNAFLDKIVPIS